MSTSVNLFACFHVLSTVLAYLVCYFSAWDPFPPFRPLIDPLSLPLFLLQKQDDDDMDLFGDDEEETAKHTLSRAEQVAAMKAEKEAKEKANKKRDRSQIVLEVKPTDTEVNLDELYSTIKKEISPSGLTWGEGYNKSPVAYGIFKLIISMVVFDDEVSIDDVVEKIEAMEDQVQSVDINSFNKL